MTYSEGMDLSLCLSRVILKASKPSSSGMLVYKHFRSIEIGLADSGKDSFSLISSRMCKGSDPNLEIILSENNLLKSGLADVKAQLNISNTNELETKIAAAKSEVLKVYKETKSLKLAFDTVWTNQRELELKLSKEMAVLVCFYLLLHTFSSGDLLLSSQRFLLVSHVLHSLS